VSGNGRLFLRIAWKALAAILSRPSSIAAIPNQKSCVLSAASEAEEGATTFSAIGSAESAGELQLNVRITTISRNFTLLSKNQ